MKRLMYVEKKTSDHHDEAWIGWVEYSRSAATLYFNGRGYRSLKGRGQIGNYADIETGEHFWISGVKKRGTNRHPFGGGVILVDRTAAAALRETLGVTALDPALFVLADSMGAPGLREELHQKENEPLGGRRRE